VLVAGVRQGRTDHLGDTGDRLPLDGPGPCPRGASFSWYTYSPTRVRYPHARGVLVEMFRAEKSRAGGDPVAAWAEITGDPDKRRRYQSARGKGGPVRIGWDEALEIAAAAHVHTLLEYGPDRIAGFSPIPAMSMASHAVGARFHALIGAPILSFYDWYADLPIASPQVFGDQTDVPESGDWWDAAYLMLLGPPPCTWPRSGPPGEASAHRPVGRTPLPGSHRPGRRDRLALPLRPLRLHHPLQSAARAPSAERRRAAVPLRAALRGGRARHRPAGA